MSLRIIAAGVYCVFLFCIAQDSSLYSSSYNDAGAKCVGDFNYYLSFTIMFGLPVGIVVVGLGMYCYKVRMITHKLHTIIKY